jgi:hypothetical protein
MIEYLYTFHDLQQDHGELKAVDVTLTATDWQKAARETIHLDFSNLADGLKIDPNELTEESMIQFAELVISDEMPRIKTELQKRLAQGGDEQ